MTESGVLVCVCVCVCVCVRLTNRLLCDGVCPAVEPECLVCQLDQLVPLNIGKLSNRFGQYIHLSTNVRQSR